MMGWGEGARWRSRSGQELPAGHGWTAARRLHAGCCGRPHPGGSGPPESAYMSPLFPLGCGTSSASYVPEGGCGAEVNPW